ncbi:MAG: putative metal-binding motif-containing protein [Sandaracinaceae bacterium]
MDSRGTSRTGAWRIALAFALFAAGCIATPVPVPPSVDPDRVDVFEGSPGSTVVRGDPGAVEGEPIALRVRSADGSAEGDVEDDGSFSMLVPGLPSDVFFIEGLLPTEDRFLLAVTGGIGGSASVADPGVDSDGDGSPDAIDCAPMDPMVSGSRCMTLCVAERCADMRDNDCDSRVDEGCAGMPCTSDTECSAGYVCSAAMGMGTCEPQPCMSNADCPAGLVCSAAQCIEVGSDGDGDGYRRPFDCADSNPAIHPGAVELCDMVDNNCDGTIDEMCAGASCMTDPDCPTGAVCLMNVCISMACMADSDCPMGSVCTAGACGTARRDDDMDGFSPPADCDDRNNAVHPGAVELCNMIDDNCDGFLDVGCGTMCAVDADCPFTFECAMGLCRRRACMTTMDCAMGASCVSFECQPTMPVDADMDGFSPPADCDDGDPLIHPMQPESCMNMRDDNCDGTINEGC